MAIEKEDAEDTKSGAGGTAIQVQLRSGELEVRFTERFTAADLAALKAIQGRRWDSMRRIWLVPHSPEALEALRRAFSFQLTVPDALPASNSSKNPVRPTAQDIVPGDVFRAEANRILDAMSRTIRTRDYSRKTELSYIGWARRFMRHHGSIVDRPDHLNVSHATAFLEHLAVKERLAARSRNQAAAALSFMFREVLGRDEMSAVARAKGPRNMPMVLTHREVLRVLEELRGKFFLIVVLLYSAGLRLEECLRLRVKDIDFELRQILVRRGKGQKDRYVPLARRAAELLRAQIARTAQLHRSDRAKGQGWAPLPAALDRKDPQAGYELGWQYIFPASTTNVDPATGRAGRWSLHATAVQREVKTAVRRAGIAKRASCHTFRHSFATEALRGGCDIRTLQHVMGHKDIRTTMIYLHVIEQTGYYIQSPLDRPDDPSDERMDAVSRPWVSDEIHWELAARQWAGTRKQVKRDVREQQAPPSGRAHASPENDRNAGNSDPTDEPDARQA